MKIGFAERVGMKEPITQDDYAVRRLWPDLMHHHVIGMHAEQHVRENGVIEDPMMIFTFDVADRLRASIAAHGQTMALCDGHEAAEEWAFAEIVLG